MQETWVQSLSWKDPLEKEKATGVVQYSGLENSMNCMAHGVAKSWTWLSDFHFHEEDKSLNENVTYIYGKTIQEKPERNFSPTQ